MEKEALWTKNFIFVSAANFFLFVTYYALLTTLPSAAIHEFKTSSSVAGLFTTFFIAAAIIIRPFLGSWVDRFGKQWVFIVSFIQFGVISILYGFFEFIIILLVLRFLQGLGFGMATASGGGIIADIVPDSRKGEGIGYFVMSNNIAMVVGPFIGITIYGNFGTKMLFIVAAICSAVALILSLLVRISNETIDETIDRKQQIDEPKPPLFEKGAIPIGITAAFIGFSYSSILSFMTVFAENRGLGTESGYFFAVYAVVLLLSRPFTGVWFDRYGPNAVIYPSIIVYGLGMLTIGLSYHAITFFIAAALIGVGWGTLFSSFQTVAIQRSDPNRTSVATATFLSIFDLGIGGGSFVVGVLANYMDIGSLYVYFSIYALFGLAIYFWAQKEKSEKGQTKVQKEA